MIRYHRTRRGQDQLILASLLFLGSTLLLCRKQPVGAIPAPVEHIEFVTFHVVEKEEVVTNQFHLVDRFINVHRLHREPLRPDDLRELVLVVGELVVDVRVEGVNRSRSSTWPSPGALLSPALPFADVSPDLALELVEHGVDRPGWFAIELFCSQDLPARVQGELRDGDFVVGPVPFGPEFEAGIHDVHSHLLELGHPPVDKFMHAVGDHWSRTGFEAPRRQHPFCLRFRPTKRLNLVQPALRSCARLVTAPAEGLEPPTPTLGRWRSIH